MQTESFDFVDFDLIERIVGVSPCHVQARTKTVVLTRNCEQWTFGVQVLVLHGLLQRTAGRDWPLLLQGYFENTTPKDPTVELGLGS